MNKKRFLIYVLIIVFLIGFLIWANCFMKEAYVLESESESNIAGIPNVPTVKVEEKKEIPEFLPQEIPDEIIDTAKKYDYFYYLFLYPDNKIVLYNYEPKSIKVEDSEKFHKALTDYLYYELFMNNYKIIFTTTTGAKIYKKSILDQYEEASYTPGAEDSKRYKEKMLKKKAKIDAVTDFYNECAEAMCIIDIDKKQYISIDKRHTEVAKKLLRDYERW